MDKTAKILITGSNGMVGKNLAQELTSQGYTNLLLPSSKEVDLRDTTQTERYFEEHKPEYVFHVAGKVGGILANMEKPAEFLYDNVMIGTNVINSAHKYGVTKLLNLGSSCIYPRESKQPMKEEYLLTGPLEPTNEGYALAKISTLRMCEYYNKQYGTNYITLMPCNIYGPEDHYEPHHSHVVSALLLKFHEATQKNLSEVSVWGTGTARREFLYVKDVAKAMIYFMNQYDAVDLPSFVNLGLGEDFTIKELAEHIQKVTGFTGEIAFDTTKPDGMMKKLLDISLAKKLGWSPETSLQEGLKKTYEWYVSHNTK